MVSTAVSYWLQGSADLLSSLEKHFQRWLGQHLGMPRWNSEGTAYCPVDTWQRWMPWIGAGPVAGPSAPPDRFCHSRQVIQLRWASAFSIKPGYFHKVTSRFKWDIHAKSLAQSEKGPAGEWELCNLVDSQMRSAFAFWPIKLPSWNGVWGVELSDQEIWVPGGHLFIFLAENILCLFIILYKQSHCAILT